MSEKQIQLIIDALDRISQIIDPDFDEDTEVQIDLDNLIEQLRDSE